MNVLDIFGFDFTVPLTAVENIRRENERSNLLVITRLVLRAFLEESMKLRHRMLETDTQPLNDLFMMLEKVLWHGFRSTAMRTLLTFRSPDTDLWSCISRVANSHSEMRESVNCIDQLHNISTPIARIRALLRLSVMQKKLADYLHHFFSSRFLKEYYESWALVRQEECTSLSGALMALSVLDCNLMLDQDYLQDQPPSVDLSRYVRIPSIPTDGDGEESEGSDPLKAMLDQKSYLEERNRYLESSHADMKRKVEELASASAEQQGNYSRVEETPAYDKNLLEALTKARDASIQLASEKEDSIRTLSQQLADTKKINMDLYAKVLITEEKCRQLEKELSKLKEHHTLEKEQLRRTIEALKSHNTERESEFEKKSDASELLRSELTSKTEEYMQALSVLGTKQEELNKANEKLEKLQRINSELTEKLKQMPVIEQELAALSANFDYQNRKVEEYEKALEELGGHLSESKLRMVELKEELLPLSEAHWEKDADVVSCKGCGMHFTVSRRKHHCRNCGSIFCKMCTDGRVKLPSNAKPARVCNKCFNLLQSRQNSTLGETSSLNSM